jgi:hypothetical protein
MIELTPTQRLEWLRDQPSISHSYGTLDTLLVQYERFLETTNIAEDELIRSFMDKDVSREYMDASGKFGDLVFDALDGIGKRTRFHRFVVVLKLAHQSNRAECSAAQVRDPVPTRRAAREDMGTFISSLCAVGDRTTLMSSILSRRRSSPRFNDRPPGTASGPRLAVSTGDAGLAVRVTSVFG